MNDVSVVDVVGRITLGEGASTLRDTLRTMAREGHKKILLNLSDVSYVDSSGLGVLVAGFASIASHGGSLKLSNLTNRVSDLLLITKLFTVFEVFDHESVAIRSFTEAPVETSTAKGL
jgi:anti-sigma B factor antagonist